MFGYPKGSAVAVLKKADAVRGFRWTFVGGEFGRLGFSWATMEHT